jgi:hypothetical protein
MEKKKKKEITAENFPNLGKDVDIKYQVQEAFTTPNTHEHKKTSPPCHIS